MIYNHADDHGNALAQSYSIRCSHGPHFKTKTCSLVAHLQRSVARGNDTSSQQSFFALQFQNIACSKSAK